MSFYAQEKAALMAVLKSIDKRLYEIQLLLVENAKRERERNA